MLLNKIKISIFLLNIIHSLCSNIKKYSFFSKIFRGNMQIMHLKFLIFKLLVILNRFLAWSIINQEQFISNNIYISYNF